MTEEERRAWDWYYMTLVGWQFHPGNRKEPQLDLTEAAYLATEMVEVRRENMKRLTSSSSSSPLIAPEDC